MGLWVVSEPPEPGLEEGQQDWCALPCRAALDDTALGLFLACRTFPISGLATEILLFLLSL